MRVELGAEIIFEVHGGVAAVERWHLPAPEHSVPNRSRRKGKRGRPPVTRLRFAEQVAPLAWTSLCGLTGWVYAYGPHAARGRCCPVCLNRAPALVTALPVALQAVAPAVCVGCGMPLTEYTPKCAHCWDRQRRRRQREQRAAA